MPPVQRASRPGRVRRVLRQRPDGTWLPIDPDMETEYTLVPDVEVYVPEPYHTGILDANGNSIMRAGMLPIGFTADHGDGTP